MIGIGTRKGIKKEEVIRAITEGLKDSNRGLDEVEKLSTSDLKKTESGLILAAEELGKEIVFLQKDVINQINCPSPSKATKIGLKGVCEPCALAISKEKELIMTKRIYGGVTIAIAR